MEAFAEIAAYFLSWILGFFAEIDLSPVATALETLKPYLQAALYILPAETIKQQWAIVVSIWSFRLTIKAIKTIWQLIPFL